MSPAAVVWGVLDGGALFWGVFTVLHVFTFLLLSLRIYFVGQFRLGAYTCIYLLGTPYLIQLHTSLLRQFLQIENFSHLSQQAG